MVTPIEQIPRQRVLNLINRFEANWILNESWSVKRTVCFLKDNFVNEDQATFFTHVRDDNNEKNV